MRSHKVIDKTEFQDSLVLFICKQYSTGKNFFESFSSPYFNFQDTAELKLAVNGLIWLKANKADQDKN